MREPARADVRPAPALLSPAWLIALALLIANDRWLKYADLGPGWLTGKLSDLAGMVVAPVLLAVLLGVRRRSGLLACHVAVGLVFAAIKLSPVCAAWWSSGMGLLGYPWTIVCDPTDLLALPFLLLSWRVLLPYMNPDVSALVPLQRSAVAGLAGVGLWASVATTERPVPPPFYDDVYGQLYINNSGDVPVTFHTRRLRDEVTIDCDEVALDPGRLLSPEAFGEGEYWTLEPGVNLGLEIFGTKCGAVWIAGEGLAPTIVFIDFHFYALGWWPGFTQNSDDLGEFGLGFETQEDGSVEWLTAEYVRFVPRTDPLEQPPECEPPAAESRIDWSDGELLPEYPTELAAIEAGPDGCYEFTLQEWGIEEDNGPVPFGEPTVWYLCAPPTAMPFVAGEFVEFDHLMAASGTRELTMTLLDATTLLPATGDNGEYVRSVRYLHGGTGPQFIGPAVEQDFEPVVAIECPWRLEPGCATAERVSQMRRVGSEPFTVGDPVLFPSSLINRTMVLSYMRQRAVVDQACTDGAEILSYDIDLALVEEAG